MPSLKRDHHTVSKFYLAGFADGSKQIRRTPLANPEAAEIISISQASVVRDFYLLPTPDGALNDGVENIFSEVESNGARGFRALLVDQEWPIRLVTRGRIAMWVALQHLRGAAMRSIVGLAMDISVKEQIIKGGREGIRDVLDRGQEVKATEAEVDEAWATYSDIESFRLQASSVEHVAYIRDQLRVLTEELFMRPWMVMRFENIALVTCDHPAAWGPATSESDFAGGVFIPMSRRVGLLMGEKQPEAAADGSGVTVDHLVPGTQAQALFYNNWVIAHAWDEVFTHPDDADLARWSLPPPRRR